MAEWNRGSLRLDTRREGFALSLVLLVMIVLTGGVLTAYTLTSSEHWQVNDRQEQLRAFLLAEEGLQRFYATSQGVRPTDGGCSTLALVGGSAEVCTYLLRAALSVDDPEIWVVRSRAWTEAPGNPNLPPAARSVAQIAHWKAAEIKVEAGLKSLGGVKKNGNSGEINGNDACGEKGPLPALAIPENPKYDDKFPNVLKTDLVDEFGNKQRIRYVGNDAFDAARDVEIDWPGIVNGTALRPDVKFEQGDKWVDPSSRTEKPWPVVFYDGNLSGSPKGQGILIVTGNLTINGNAEWKGIILIGGSLISNGNNVLSGATIAGLNAVFGEEVDESTIEETTLNGTKVITYNSCDVAKAMESFASFTPIHNAWMDAWPVVDPVVDDE